MMLANKAIEESQIKSGKLKKYLALFVVILSGLIFYTINATKSGLWFDESVEYFYSKYPTGTVPGGFGTTNMLERILSTYQPPLYNVLMYLWLLVFDSEFAFRFAGIIITMIGAVGCYFAIDEILRDSFWSILGTIFYLFSSGVVYYGLECAEYNLMLCFLAWTVYFFIRVLVRYDWKSMAGFFVFACLSVYSQYGAAFIVTGMAVSLILFFVFGKKYKELKRFLLMSVITCVVAVIPLIVFFVLPQMSSQGSTSISHSPFFQHNFIVDFVLGGGWVLVSNFGYVTVFVVIALLIICLFTLFVRPKTLLFPVLSLFITWILYFIAVCCSYYGYNNWYPDSIGSGNLGGRYSLFLIPGMVVVLIIGMGIFAKWIKEKNTKLYRIVMFSAVLLLTAYSSIEIYRASIEGWVKDDIREITSVWYDCEGYKSKTLLHQRDDTTFNFYLIHDDRYNAKYDDSIEAADMWIGTAEYDEMKDNLQDMGYLDIDDFYYVAPNSGSYQAFLSVVKDAGYDVEEIYSGQSLLLHLVKT